MGSRLVVSYFFKTLLVMNNGGENVTIKVKGQLYIKGEISCVMDRFYYTIEISNVIYTIFR